MSSDPIQGEPRRRLIRVTRQRVALAAAAVLAALWLALVEELHAGNDPVVKAPPSTTAAATTTATTTTPKTDTNGKTETTTTETTTQTSTSASTSTTSQS